MIIILIIIIITFIIIVVVWQLRVDVSVNSSSFIVTFIAWLSSIDYIYTYYYTRITYFIVYNLSIEFHLGAGLIHRLYVLRKGLPIAKPS